MKVDKQVIKEDRGGLVVGKKYYLDGCRDAIGQYVGHFLDCIFFIPNEIASQVYCIDPFLEGELIGFTARSAEDISKGLID